MHVPWGIRFKSIMCGSDSVGGGDSSSDNGSGSEMDGMMIHTEVTIMKQMWK